jgi:hypothetical protein
VANGGKFTAGAIDPAANLPPVSLIPVVHLDFLLFMANFLKNLK